MSRHRPMTRPHASPRPVSARSRSTRNARASGSRRGVRLDLGGVGKGLAADLVARGLVDRGARTALVGMGGDLRARGEPPPRRLVGRSRCSIRSTRRASRSGSRSRRRDRHQHRPASAAGRGAVAGTTTSSTPRRATRPASGVAAVVVAARDAWWAEGIAKSIVIGGADAGTRLAEHAAGVGVALPRRRRDASNRDRRRDARRCSAS